MAIFINALWQGLNYRGRESHWAFIFHRVSGLAVLLFLGIHILDTATVYFIPSLYEHAIGLYRTTLFMLGEIGLVAALLYHGLNGYKIIYFDQKPARWKAGAEAQWFWVIVVASFLLWLPAAFIMGRSLWLNNICQCPPVAESGPVVFPAWANTGIVISLAAAVIIVARLAMIKSALPGVKRNFDTWMWLFMRWSGVLLVPLAWVHVLINDVIVGVHAIDLDYVALRWASIGWQAYDVALLAFTFAHGMNGLRTIVNDYFHNEGLNKFINRALLIAWLVITIIGAVAIIGGVRSATGV